MEGRDVVQQAEPDNRRLGITGYAVLGLLSRGPRSGYEIAGVLTRGVAGNMFARRASTSYEEPRRLVAQGLAAAGRAWQGRRARTVYTLTEAGRKALADWRGQPSAPPVFELEALLKVLFADGVGDPDARRAVDEVAAWAQERFRLGAEIIAGYQAGSGRFQAHAPLVRLTTMANIEIADALARWSRRARAELDSGGCEGFDDLAEDLRARAVEHELGMGETS